MPISVTCKCGKKLKVKDEWAGKRWKCPTCSATFQIPAPGIVAVKGKPKREAKAPAIHFSPTAIVFISLAVLIPTLIFLARIGPIKAQHDWDRISEQADYDVRDVMTRALQAWLSIHTDYNPRDPRLAPTASSPTFAVTAWMFSVPDPVGFIGKTREGIYHGLYGTRSGEIDAQMLCGGQEVHVTGHVRNGNIESFIDGQPAIPIDKPMVGD
jgi:hypothetical protein